MARQMGLGEEFDQALLVAPGAVSPTAYFPDYTAPAPRTPEALPTTRTTAPVAATAQVDYSRPPEPLPASSPPDYSQPPEPAARKEEQDAG